MPAVATTDIIGVLERSDVRRWKLAGRLTTEGRVAYWKSFWGRARTWEQRWRAELRQIFNDQEREVIGKLRRWHGHTLKSAPLHKSAEPLFPPWPPDGPDFPGSWRLRELFAPEADVGLPLPEWAKAHEVKAPAFPESEIDRALLNHAEWNVVLSSTGRRLGEAIMLEGGLQFLDDFAIAGLSFDMDTPGVRRVLDERYGNPQYHLQGTWPEWINGETNRVLGTQLKDEFQAQLQESLTSGESLSKCESRVENVFGQAKGYRTQRIARTETLGAHNTGNHTALVESGTPGEEWISNQLGDVRDFHSSEMDGVIVPAKEPFAVRSPSGGVDYLRHPGEFGAPARQTINCQCTSAPVWDKDEIRAGIARRESVV